MPRPRKSITQHKLDGSYRADRHGGVPRGEPINPAPPQGLNAAERQAWGEIVGAVREFLMQQDRTAVEILAQLIAQMRADPATIPSARMTQLISLCRRLGMTPKSRASLDPVVPADAGEDPFEGFSR